MSDFAYHAGELDVQARSGEAAVGARNARVVRDAIIPGAFDFIAHQFMLVATTVGPGETPWPSLLLGDPGFVTAVDPHTLAIDLGAVLPADEDEMWENLSRDPRIGLLLLDLDTRRRFRVNGEARRESGLRVEVSVREAYANCPKYIQTRRLTGASRPEGPGRRRASGVRAGAEQIELIDQTDTMFVASVAPDGPADASHRGGPPSFVQVIDERTLRIPDYPGNSMYNTLGNIAVNPSTGLLLLDFDRSRTLQVSGTARIRWDLEDPTPDTGGTGRYWDVAIERWVESALPVELVWGAAEASPFNPPPPPSRAATKVAV